MVMNKGDTDYFKNPTLLFRLIEERQWRDVIEHNKEYQAEAKQWVVKRDKDSGSITWRRLPIHEACIRQPTEEVMISLLETFPETARASDTYGRLPLHHACVHGAQEAVIHHLLMAYPDSIEVRDVWGKTPLAAAQATLCGNKNQILELLQKRPSYYAVKVVEADQKKMLKLQAEKYEKAHKVERNEYKKLVESLKIQLKVATVDKDLFSDKLTSSEDEVSSLQNTMENNDIKIKSLESIKTCLENEADSHQTKYSILQQSTDDNLNTQQRAYDTIQDQFSTSKIEVLSLQDKLEKKCTEVSSLLDSEAKLIANVEGQNDEHTELEKQNKIQLKGLDEKYTEVSAKLIMLEQSVKDFAEHFSVPLETGDLSKTLRACERSIKDHEMWILQNVDNLKCRVKEQECDKNSLDESLSELKKMKTSIKKSQNTVDMTEKINVVLTKEKSTLEKSFKDVTTELEMLQQSHSKLETKTSSTLVNKEKLLQLYTDKISGLNASLKQSDVIVSDLKNESKQRTTELDEMKNQLTAETVENKTLKDSMSAITARARQLEEKVLHSGNFFTTLDGKFSSLVENQDELLMAASHQEQLSPFSYSSKSDNKEDPNRNHTKSISEKHHRILSSVRQQKVILQSIRSQKLALKMAAAEAMMNEKKSGHILIR